MKTLPPRLIAAAVLALLASALVINAGPWPSFARFAESYFKPHTNYSKQDTKASSEQSQSTLDETSLKSGAYFTIYRNDQGEAVCRGSTLAEVRQMEVNTRQLRLRPINHPELYSTQSQQQPLAAGSGLTIILRATEQLQQNPTAVTAFTRAAQNWEALVMSPVTIYIDVDFGTTFFGQTFPSGALGATSAPAQSYPYDSARTNLVAEANGEGNVTKQAVFDALPSTTVPTDLGTSGSTVVSDPTARAIGLLPATAASADPAAKIGFNSNFTFDFDPSDGITSGQLDFDAVATHEIGHALGFHSEAGRNLPRPAVWDLYRFRTGTSTGTFTNAQRLVTIGGSPDPLQFFFVPGNNELGLSTGGTSGSFGNGGDGWQSSHWKHATGCSPYIGIMDPAIGSGCRRTITSNDTLALSYFGYNLTNNNPPPPPPTPPMPPANDNFANAQVVSGCSGTVNGTSFSATNESGEPSHDPPDSLSLSPGHTVWYQWQPPSSGTTTITTAGSDFDTILAVYTGSSVGSLTRISFNDDVQAGTLTSSLTLSADAGTTYWIVVDGWSGDAGGIKLNWFGCAVPTPTPTPTGSPSPGPCASFFTLDDPTDNPDVSAGDGLCATALGSCSLRAAIQEANARPSCGPITINYSGAGSPITLNTPLTEINHNVSIVGPGANQLTVKRSTAVGTPSFSVFVIASGRTVTISGMTISNGVGNPGGGIKNQGNLTLTDCNLYGNTVVGGQVGGGIYSNGTVTLNSVNIGGLGPGQANTAGAGAGYYGAVLTMNFGSVVGNAGVGLTLTGGPNQLTEVTISNNSGLLDGGGLDIWGSLPTRIRDCLIADNSAVRNGGGINGGGNITIVNSTISGNRSRGTGGGLVGSATLTNVTLTNNRSDSDDSGNESGGGISGFVILRNSIVGGNFRGTANTPNDISGTADSSSSFNLIGIGGSGGLSNGVNNNHVGINLLGLGPLADNGGRSMTHALQADSLALNAGSNALAVDQNGSPLTTDQRGVSFNRIVNGTVDIGAFEVQLPPTGPTPTPTPTPTPVPTPVACVTALTVNDTSDAGDGSPGNAVCATAGGVCTLRAAIQEANAATGCGTIDINFNVGQGTIILLTALPSMNHNVNVNGPGRNSLTVQRSAAFTAPQFPIFTINPSITATISGLTISHGDAAGTLYGIGGGIFNSGTLTLNRSLVSGNTAFNGGGIFNVGTMTVNDSIIEGNQGGGIVNHLVSDNPNRAGVVSSLTINNSIISNNTGFSGVHNDASLGSISVCVINNSTISGNSNSFGWSGGVHNVAADFGSAATLTINKSTVSSNSANNNSGAGISNLASGDATARLNLINSTVSNNYGAARAGGIYQFSQHGSAVARVRMVNSTIFQNTTTDNNGAGGILSSLFDGGTSVLTMDNSIVAGNTVTPPGWSLDIAAAVDSGSSFNLIGNGATLFGISNGSNGNQIGTTPAPINPNLGPLTNNGGLTLTHALLNGSPAINAGNNARAVDVNGNPLFTDQRGFSRVINNTVDIGALEFGAAPLLLTDGNNRVVAIDSVTFVRDPFSVVGNHNFSSDQRTRVMIFTSNLGLTQPSTELSVTSGVVPLMVEGVGTLADAPDISYLIVKLDPLLIGNVQLSVTFHGVTSNVGILSVGP